MALSERMQAHMDKKPRQGTPEMVTWLSEQNQIRAEERPKGKNKARPGPWDPTGQRGLKEGFKKKAEKRAKKKARNEAYRADLKARSERAAAEAAERKSKRENRPKSPWLKGLDSAEGTTNNQGQPGDLNVATPGDDGTYEFPDMQGMSALSDLAESAGTAMGEMMGDRSNQQADPWQRQPLQDTNWGPGSNLNQLGTASGVMGDPGTAGAMGDMGDPGLEYELSGSGPFDPASMNAPSGFASGNQAPLPTNQEYRDPQPPSAANFPPSASAFGPPNQDPAFMPDPGLPADNNLMLDPFAAATAQFPEPGGVQDTMDTATSNINNMLLPYGGGTGEPAGFKVPESPEMYGGVDPSTEPYRPYPEDDYGSMTPDPLSQIKPSMLNPPGGMGPAPTTSDAGITPDFPQMTPGPDSTYPELGMTPTAPPIGAIDYEALQDPGNLGTVEGMVEGDAARLGGMPPEDLRPLDPFGGPALADPAPVPGASGVAPYQGVGEPALRDLAMRTETPSAFGRSDQSQAYRDMFPNRQQPAANNLASLSTAATGGDPSIGMMPNPLNTGSPAGPGLGGGVRTRAPKTTRFNV